MGLTLYLHFLTFVAFVLLASFYLPLSPTGSK